MKESSIKRNEIKEENEIDLNDLYQNIYDDIYNNCKLTVKEKASKLLSYYFETPDRSDKEFDTLDLCMVLLSDIVNE